MLKFCLPRMCYRYRPKWDKKNMPVHIAKTGTESFVQKRTSVGLVKVWLELRLYLRGIAELQWSGEEIFGGLDPITLMQARS
jgi:hypothetical protein